MYNKVVAIDGGPPGYYFVLHYIPDMQWCHVAEMGQEGVFPKTYKNGSYFSKALYILASYRKYIRTLTSKNGCNGWQATRTLTPTAPSGS
jgi:hypothetical protein